MGRLFELVAPRLAGYNSGRGGWLSSIPQGGLLAAAVFVSACTPAPPKANIPYRQNFAAAALGPEWSSRGGGWLLRDGRLYNDGARNVPLWLDARLPADVRVTFSAESKSPAVDIKCEIFGDGKHHESGYVVIYAGWNNQKSIIARLDEHGPERQKARTQQLRSELASDPAAARARYRRQREIVARPHRGEPNRVYRWRLERRGGDLSLYVDDQLHLSYFDPAPLSGPDHDRFAFNNWASEVFFDDLIIEPLTE